MSTFVQEMGMQAAIPAAKALMSLRRVRSLGVGVLGALVALAAYAETATLALPANALLFAPIYVAADAGLWKQRGLDVKLPVVAGPGATNAVIAGSADFVSTAATSVLRAAARGQAMQIIASTNEEYLLNLVVSPKAMAERKIDPKADLATRMKALKGATLAIDVPLGLPHGFIKYVAAKVGMDADRDFVLTPMQPPNMVSSLKSGAIDGFMFGEPFVSLAVQGGAQIVIQLARTDMPELNPYSTNLIAARAGFCKQTPAVCSKLVGGLTDALKMIQDDPQRVKGILRARFAQLPPQVLDASFEQIRATSPRSAVTHEAALANTQRVSLVAGTLKPEERRDDLAALIDNEFAK
jgi:ABC-type nitrate/sulfonate/bicarbonate transport system substrate-binding protein